MREIAVGDRLATWHDGRVVSGYVTAFIPQGEDDIFEVRTEGSLVKGNAKHPFKVLREDETFEWVRLDNLRRGDLIVQAANLDLGSKEDFSADEMWALGFMFGDGWVTERQRRELTGIDRWGNHIGQEIVVPPGDKAAARRATHRKASRKYDRKIGKVQRQSIPGADYVTCIADSKAWPERARRAVEILEDKFDCQFKLTRFGYWRCEKQDMGRWLHAFGLGAGAKNKRVPVQVFQQSAQLRDAFLAGFAAADGCVEDHSGDQAHFNAKGGHSVQAIQLANRLLIDDLRHLARTLGYRVTNVHERTGVNQAPSSPTPKEYFSATFKYHWRTTTREPFMLSRVKSVKPCGDERSNIPTHNTTIVPSRQTVADRDFPHWFP
jgi:hypothetical protein